MFKKVLYFNEILILSLFLTTCGQKDDNSKIRPVSTNQPTAQQTPIQENLPQEVIVDAQGVKTTCSETFKDEKNGNTICVEKDPSLPFGMTSADVSSVSFFTTDGQKHDFADPNYICRWDYEQKTITIFDKDSGEFLGSLENLPPSIQNKVLAYLGYKEKKDIRIHEAKTPEVKYDEAKKPDKEEKEGKKDEIAKGGKPGSGGAGGEAGKSGGGGGRDIGKTPDASVVDDKDLDSLIEQLKELEKKVADLEKKAGKKSWETIASEELKKDVNEAIQKVASKNKEFEEAAKKRITAVIEAAEMGESLAKRTFDAGGGIETARVDRAYLEKLKNKFKDDPEFQKKIQETYDIAVRKERFVSETGSLEIDFNKYGSDKKYFNSVEIYYPEFQKQFLDLLIKDIEQKISDYEKLKPGTTEYIAFLRNYEEWKKKYDKSGKFLPPLPPSDSSFGDVYSALRHIENAVKSLRDVIAQEKNLSFEDTKALLNRIQELTGAISGKFQIKFDPQTIQTIENVIRYYFVGVSAVLSGPHGIAFAAAFAALFLTAEEADAWLFSAERSSEEALYLRLLENFETFLMFTAAFKGAARLAPKLTEVLGAILAFQQTLHDFKEGKITQGALNAAFLAAAIKYLKAQKVPEVQRRKGLEEVIKSKEKTERGIRELEEELSIIERTIRKLQEDLAARKDEQLGRQLEEAREIRADLLRKLETAKRKTPKEAPKERKIGGEILDGPIVPDNPLSEQWVSWMTREPKKSIEKARAIFEKLKAYFKFTEEQFLEKFSTLIQDLNKKLNDLKTAEKQERDKLDIDFFRWEELTAVQQEALMARSETLTLHYERLRGEIPLTEQEVNYLNYLKNALEALNYFDVWFRTGDITSFQEMMNRAHQISSIGEKGNSPYTPSHQHYNTSEMFPGKTRTHIPVTKEDPRMAEVKVGIPAVILDVVQQEIGKPIGKLKIFYEPLTGFNSPQPHVREILTIKKGDRNYSIEVTYLVRNGKKGFAVGHVKIEGIKSEHSPKNWFSLGGEHHPPSSKHIDEYFKYAQTLMEKIRKIKPGEDQETLITLLSDYYHVMISAHPYFRVNNSMIMSHVNYILKRHGLKPLSHTDMDFWANTLSTPEFRRFFRDEINDQAKEIINDIHDSEQAISITKRKAEHARQEEITQIRRGIKLTQEKIQELTEKLKKVKDPVQKTLLEEDIARDKKLLKTLERQLKEIDGSKKDITETEEEIIFEEEEERWIIKPVEEVVVGKPPLPESKPKYKTIPLRVEYRQGSLQPHEAKVRYFTPEERAHFELKLGKDGLIRDANGELYDTFGQEAIFVMDENGRFFASEYSKYGVFHHSSLVEGGPVSGAGKILVKEGKLILLIDESGHYHPTRELTQQVLSELAEYGIVPEDIIYVAPVISPEKVKEKSVRAEIGGKGGSGGSGGGAIGGGGGVTPGKEKPPVDAGVPKERTINELEKGLRDKDAAVRAQAAIELRGRINENPKVRGLIIKGLKDSAANVRQSAVIALEDVKDPEIIALLVRMVKFDESAGVRAQIIILLATIEDPKKLLALFQELLGKGSTPALVRQTIADVLAYMDDPKAVTLLIGLLKDKDASVRATAATSLGEKEFSKTILDALRGALKDKDPKVRAAAAEAIGKLGERTYLGNNKVVDELIALLNVKGDPSVRAAAAEALEKIGGEKAGAALEVLIKDPDKNVRLQAIIGLVRIGGAHATRGLIGAMKDRDEDVRKAAEEGYRLVSGREISSTGGSRASGGAGGSGGSGAVGGDFILVSCLPGYVMYHGECIKKEEAQAIQEAERLRDAIISEIKKKDPCLSKGGWYVGKTCCNPFTTYAPGHECGSYLLSPEEKKTINEIAHAIKTDTKRKKRCADLAGYMVGNTCCTPLTTYLPGHECNPYTEEDRELDEQIRIGNNRKTCEKSVAGGYLADDGITCCHPLTSYELPHPCAKNRMIEEERIKEEDQDRKEREDFEKKEAIQACAEKGRIWSEKGNKCCESNEILDRETGLCKKSGIVPPPKPEVTPPVEGEKPKEIITAPPIEIRTPGDIKTPKKDEGKKEGIKVPIFDIPKEGESGEIVNTKPPIIDAQKGGRGADEARRQPGEVVDTKPPVSGTPKSTGETVRTGPPVSGTPTSPRAKDPSGTKTPAATETGVKKETSPPSTTPNVPIFRIPDRRSGAAIGVGGVRK